MPRAHALLLSGASNGLPGLDNDLAVVATALAKRYFELTTCTGPEATPGGIRQHLATLVSTTQPGDAIVVYYTGHGGILHDPVSRISRRYLVPYTSATTTATTTTTTTTTTTKESTSKLLDVEFADYLYQIAERTDNLTVVLDCCFAAEVFRDESLKPPSPNVLHKQTFHTKQSEPTTPPTAETSTSVLDPVGHPRIVRLFAAHSQAQALVIRHEGDYISLFTHLLVAALDEEIDHPMPWDALIRRIQARVEACNGPRPDLAGPRWRRPFSSLVLRPSPAVTVATGTGHRSELRAGRLHGLELHDELDLHWADADARGHVIAIGDAHAQLEVRGPAPPAGACACLRAASNPVKTFVAPELRPELERSPWLRLVDQPSHASFSLAVTNEGIVTRGNQGFVQRTLARERSEFALAELEAVVRSRRFCATLEQLRAGRPADHCPAGFDWSCTAFRVNAHGQRLLPAQGARLDAGTRLWLQLGSPGGSRLLYINVVRVDVGGRVRVLNRSQPAGIPLVRGLRYDFGSRPGATLGVPLEWPAGLDPTRAQPERLLVLATLAPLELSSLELTEFDNIVNNDRPPLFDPSRTDSTDIPTLLWDLLEFEYFLAPPNRV